METPTFFMPDPRDSSGASTHGPHAEGSDARPAGPLADRGLAMPEQTADVARPPTVSEAGHHPRAQPRPAKPPNESLPTGAEHPRHGRPPQEPLPSPSDLILERLSGSQHDDRKPFRRALVVAALVHLVVFFITFPEAAPEISNAGRPAQVFVMEQVRFKKPPARATQEKKEIPKKRAKKIPIPDPTPDEPEPLEIEPVDIPEVEMSEIEDVTFGIPDGPAPGPNLTGPTDFFGTAMQLGGGIGKPVAISKSRPSYTEEARQKRIQGVVILSGIVDQEGIVRNLEVIKGLPFGLDSEALETVQTWRFRPAMHQGKPVAVYMHFTVSFGLQ